MQFRTEHDDFKPVRAGSHQTCDDCAFNGTDTCHEMACIGWDFPADHDLRKSGLQIIWVNK